jgi:tRNA(fMet)-specific endonuclease VapC
LIRYLLDTNIVIYAMNKRPLSLLEAFNAHGPELAISSMTLGELVFGAERSERVQQNLRRIEDLCSRLLVLPYADKAAHHVGQIKAALTEEGKAIGENDIHIAGHARSEGLILVTNNVQEFSRVPALQVENWIKTDPSPASKRKPKS